MKTISLIFILFIAIYSSAFSQDTDVYTILDDVLSEDEKTIVSDAIENISKGDTYLAKAETEDEATAKLFTSSKKKKQKKAEKKSVEAKKYRIKAATFYDKGNQAIFDLYMEKLNSAEYEFTEDNTQAQTYVDDGNTLFAEGQRTLVTYKAYTDDNLESSVKYSTLKSDLKTMKTNEDDALQMLADAITLWKSQTAKKQKQDLADEQAWKGALTLNTIPAYKNYLASYPTGLHAQEAADKIETLEETFLTAQQTTSKNLVYKVQILADKKKWTTTEIKSKIYFGTETVVERYADSYYKYSIGEFTNYTAAKAFKNKCGVKSAFVVCFVDGTQVDITKALDVEGVKPK